LNRYTHPLRRHAALLRRRRANRFALFARNSHKARTHHPYTCTQNSSTMETDKSGSIGAESSFIESSTGFLSDKETEYDNN
jgi:hypothetical protein